MIEKKIYQEVPGGRNNFHSAVLTSFSFNFHHFENQVLRTLRQKWVSSVSVLVDQRMLDIELGLSSGNLKYLSRTYSISGIKSKGAFHPKINFLVGDDQLLLFFGSGNITSGGHGKNHELFTGFYADHENQIQLPIILEAWEYLRSFAYQTGGFNRKRIFKTLPNNCTLLKTKISKKHVFHKLDEELEVALLYHDDLSIFNQIQYLVPNDRVSKITVVSPYFDEDGSTLLNLKSHFKAAEIDVFLLPGFGLHPTKIKQPHHAIEFYDWSKTLRGQKTISGLKNYARKPHSKLIHFAAGKEEYCLIGSANATIAGLGDEKNNGINEEFCALYKVANSGLLERLGLTGKKVEISFSDMIRDVSPMNESRNITKTKKLNIVCADLNGNHLGISYDKTYDADIYFSIYDCDGVRLLSYELVKTNQRKPLKLTLSNDLLDKNPSYVVFESETEHAISNKQPINFLDNLRHTNPSKGNRNAQIIIGALESGKINEFEIIEFINNLNNNREKARIVKGSKSSASDSNKAEVNASETDMTYEEAVEAAKNPQKAESVVRGHYSTLFWDTISRLFLAKDNNVKEELMDEEEEGSAERSRDREVVVQDKNKYTVKNKNQFNRILNSVKKLVDNYVKQLNKVYWEEEYKVNELDLSNFLIVSYILTAVCKFNDYEFLEEKSSKSKQKELLQLYDDRMLELLEHFTKLLIKFELAKKQENEERDYKLEEYSSKVGYHFWLYLYFIYRDAKDDRLRDKIELITLNFLHYYGVPDKGFKQHLKTLSSSYNDLIFNPPSVTNFFEHMKSKFLNSDQKYIGIEKNGICLIKSKNQKEIELTSLFKHDRYSHAKMKKLAFPLNLNDN